MTDDSANLAPIFVMPHEAIAVKEAVSRFGYSDKHIRRLFARYKLGAKAGRNSPLRISEPALSMVQHGDFAALERLRDGERDHPSVVRYFLQLGYILVPGRRTKVSEPLPEPQWMPKKAAPENAPTERECAH
jgi:transposase